MDLFKNNKQQQNKTFINNDMLNVVKFAVLFEQCRDSLKWVDDKERWPNIGKDEVVPVPGSKVQEKLGVIDDFHANHILETFAVRKKNFNIN